MQYGAILADSRRQTSVYANQVEILTFDIDVSSNLNVEDKRVNAFVLVTYVYTI
jgi:hypothetical protein